MPIYDHALICTTYFVYVLFDQQKELRTFLLKTLSQNIFKTNRANSKKKIVREYIPSVIEPSFGIGRILYSLLEHSYYTREGDEQRSVFSFPVCVAPTKVLVAPISHNEAFLPIIKTLGAF